MFSNGFSLTISTSAFPKTHPKNHMQYQQILKISFFSSLQMLIGKQALNISLWGKTNVLKMSIVPKLYSLKYSTSHFTGLF